MVKFVAVLSSVVILSVCGAAGAATIDSGVFLLGNHPDGAASTPAYGLRLDELYNETASHDIFTFDFNHAQSLMTLLYNSALGTITIDGVVHGGRDTGNDYANDAYLGLYTVHILYDVGVSQVPGDDDLWVTSASGSNFGTITTPLNDTFDLSDINMDFSFRLGDEDNDLGHRGYAGISGWGWLSIDGVHVESNDWLFTAQPIPEPATGLLALVAAGLLIRRRR